MVKYPGVVHLPPTFAKHFTSGGLTMEVLQVGRLLLVPWGQTGDILYISAVFPDTSTIEVISMNFQAKRKLTLQQLQAEQVTAVVALPEGRDFSRHDTFTTIPAGEMVLLSQGQVVVRSGSRRWVRYGTHDLVALPIFPVVTRVALETIPLPPKPRAAVLPVENFAVAGDEDEDEDDIEGDED